MTPTLLPDWKSIIEQIYAPGTCRDILVSHSGAVADMALGINERLGLGLEQEQVKAAAMLHDIGIAMTDAPGIDCHGAQPYICHGVLGADLLRLMGAPEWAARVAERHTGAGLTPDDIDAQRLPLPTDRILTPQTLLERLICYADKFYSKSPGHLTEAKPFEMVRDSMARFGEATLARFDALENEFGRNNINSRSV